MAGNHVIQVPLPPGVDVTSDDLALLEAVFQGIVALRYPGEGQWKAAERALVSHGWTVHARVMWLAEARRGWEAEEATGTTKDEAFANLLELTKADELAGVP